MNAYKTEGAIFWELYDNSQCENGQAPVSSVLIFSAILEDNLDFALTWVVLLSLFMILKDIHVYFPSVCTEQTNI